MKVDWNEKIAGVDMLRVRDSLKAVSRYVLFSRQAFASCSDLGRVRGLALFDELVRRGLIEKSEHQGFGVRLGKDADQALTMAGHALSSARKVARMSRAKAQAELDAFLGRVRVANADMKPVYGVTRVHLFGSMLNEEADDVGDIDLIVETALRVKGVHWRDALNDYNALIRRLRARRTRISIHEPDQIEVVGRTRIIFEAQ